MINKIIKITILIASLLTGIYLINLAPNVEIVKNKSELIQSHIKKNNDFLNDLTN